METFANICVRGHVLVSDLSAPGLANPEEGFCNECGREVVSACTSCERPIPGAVVDYLWGLQGYERPAYCRGCGAPFPWTAWALAELRATVDADDEIPADRKEQLKQDIGELVRDEPSPSAVRRSLGWAKRVLNDPTTRQIAVNTISEAAKRMMSGM